MAEKLKRLWELSFDIAWAGVILLLPITSLPVLSRLAGGTMVAPASLIPLAWVGIFWFLAYLIKKGTIARESIPLLFFVTVAIITSAAAFFINIPTFKHAGIASEEISAGLTLAIGLAFYAITVGWLSRSDKRIVNTLKFVNISGGVMIGWALIQAYFIYFKDSNYPNTLVNIQHIFSVSDLFKGRMTGMAFEPSWMANQLNMIFLPFWLASTVTSWSAFRIRLWKFSIENILLAVGVIILVLSSRVGMLSFLAVAAFLGIYYNVLIGKRIRKWSLGKLSGLSPTSQKITNGLLSVSILVVFLVVYAAGSLGLLYGLSRLDWRLARFFQVTSEAQFQSITTNLYTIFNYLLFAERVVFWQGGWGVFNLFPLIGVGLGNAGFFFKQTLPPFGWNLPEVLNSLYRVTVVPNIKSLWVRLLAETGIIGFSSFVSWCIVMGKSSWVLRLVPTPLAKMVGWAGIFVLIAFIFEGFSVDTFALPYIWISMGIVSATAMIIREKRAGAK